MKTHAHFPNKCMNKVAKFGVNMANLKGEAPL